MKPELTSSWMSSSGTGLVRALRLGSTCSQKYVMKRVEWTFFYRRGENHDYFKL